MELTRRQVYIYNLEVGYLLGGVIAEIEITPEFQ